MTSSLFFDPALTNAELMRRDLAVLWHPCTQMRDHAAAGEGLPIVPIARGDGAWLFDYDGNRYFDAISSWWTNLFGHSHPAIAGAIKAQVDRLEHVLLAGFTHEPAVRLAEALVHITPPGLDRVFYADNGSAAVEVALKMSFHAWRNAGRPAKTKFVALTGSYHGETLGALSVTDVPLYRETYDPLLIKPILVPSPDAYLAEEGESAEAFAHRRADALEFVFAEHADEIAAIILEPLVQCAAGMRMFHPAYLARVRTLCDRYAIHFIADEIAVGFGRTGTLFACEQASVTPDLMCLSKGLTGGFLPLAAVMTTNAIYEAFYAEYESLRGFLHSHSYTGNPLACTAALATIAQFDAGPVLDSNRELARVMRDAIEPLRGHPNVGDVRQAGMIAAVELVRDASSREPFDWRERRGLRVYRHGLANGALLRPLGNVVYFMPPFCSTADELREVVRVAIEGIERAVAD